MTKTKKQRSVAEKVAAESPYQRAAALWVANKIGKNPDRIWGVTFGFEADYQLSEYTWQPGDGPLLRFKNNGRDEQLPFDTVTPGQFIEECVMLMSQPMASHDSV